MRTAAIFLLIVGLYGCKAAPEHAQTAVLLSVAGGEVSKTEALTVGEEIAVFACPEGTEDYFLEAAKFIVGADGRSLSYGSTVYYPDPKQAVRFLAYFPYHKGVFSVPTDQSKPEALKQADLCGAVARSTPVATPVALEFKHLMARVVVSANQPISGVLAYNVFSGGSLDVQTGTFIATTRSSLSTSGTELILPAQTVTRLVLTVSGADYTFDGSVSLEAGRTTTLDLTLHPDTHTATLSGSSINDWSTTFGTGEPSRAVDNQFVAHWLVADYRFDQINKIGLTIKDQASGATKEYAVSGVEMVAGSTIAAASYTFALGGVPELHYPYTVSAIKFYKDATVVHTASVGNLVARTGGATLGSGQNIALTISAATASVTAQVTSSTFTLTSNVPYGSTYTTGGGSVQGVGIEPPYASRSIVFTYPAQGATASAARQHVMTITPTVDYTGAPNKRTFTVTQAAVPTSLTISAAAPGETVPAPGKTYTINVTSNTSWRSQSAVNGVTTVPASGTGSTTGVRVVVPSTSATATRTVSIDFITTAGLSGITETTRKWSGTQEVATGVLANGLYWAKGNLIASNAAAGEQGLGGCRIGAPADHGLYFQFGSLIGYKGGALANSGTGVGSTANGAFWNGAATFSWANDAMVWPTNLSGNPTSWPQGAITNQWYFGLQAGWSVNGQNIRDFLNFSTGGLANVGVGDPCSYYLGGTWRLPTQAEYTALTNTQGSGWIPWTDNQLSARWVSDSQSFSGVRGTGMWAGSGMHSTAIPDLTEHVFIPAAGYRYSLSGVLGNANVAGTYWTSTVASATNAHRLDFANSSPYIGICAGSNNLRSNGYTVRCVSN